MPTTPRSPASGPCFLRGSVGSTWNWQGCRQAGELYTVSVLAASSERGRGLFTVALPLSLSLSPTQGRGDPGKHHQEERLEVMFPHPWLVCFLRLCSRKGKSSQV